VGCGPPHRVAPLGCRSTKKTSPADPGDRRGYQQLPKRAPPLPLTRIIRGLAYGVLRRNRRFSTTLCCSVVDLDSRISNLDGYPLMNPPIRRGTQRIWAAPSKSSSTFVARNKNPPAGWIAHRVLSAKPGEKLCMRCRGGRCRARFMTPGPVRFATLAPNAILARQFDGRASEAGVSRARVWLGSCVPGSTRLGEASRTRARRRQRRAHPSRQCGGYVASYPGKASTRPIHAARLG
jgi:hypothetical protein